MLATLVGEPFDRPGWVFEEKYDGYRILAYKEGARVRLVSRNDKDRTESFGGIADAVASLKDRTLLLDGEAVAFDRRRVSRFQLLQRGGEPSLAVFYCLYRNGHDLRREPLSVRRREAEEAIGKGSDHLFVSRRFPGGGMTAYREAARRGFEGIVAKNASAPYEERRSPEWLKVKVHQEEELVIGGFTPPREKAAVWVAPRLVAQIAFQEWTADEKLRQPVFLGLRDDKKPEECRLPGPS